MRKLQSGIGFAAGALLIGAMVSPASPANAAPDEPCDSAAVCTETFGVTGAPEIWTVPRGISSISVSVAAGAGGSYFSDGGSGGVVSTTIPVTPGQEFALVVGGAGGLSYQTGAGGYGGGAGSYGPGYGGGGGGGSFIFTETGGAWNLLVAAGGGGGGGRDIENRQLQPGINGFGGSGGFATGTADAQPADSNHAAGATSTSSGYPDGASAAYDGATFTPGSGQTGANTGGSGSGGGGGGYYGGAGAQERYSGGGGGSGYLAPGLIAEETGANQGNGAIHVSYANLGSTLAVSVAETSIELGDSVDLLAVLRQFDAAGGTGDITLLATIDGETTAIDAGSVTTRGPGPYAGATTRTFTPTKIGTYVITGAFQATDGLHDSVDSYNSMTFEVTAPALPPKAPTPPKRVETGAR